MIRIQRRKSPLGPNRVRSGGYFKKSWSVSVPRILHEAHQLDFFEINLPILDSRTFEKLNMFGPLS